MKWRGYVHHSFRIPNIFFQFLVLLLSRGNCSEMFYERTNIQINKIVILVVTEDGTVQEFIKDKKDYLLLLDKELEKYYNTNNLKEISQGSDDNVVRLNMPDWG